MSYPPPLSPPLPTFAIKDLCGPANPPGLISISKRRYDATIRSTPDATLLYLDDDDGELITVGSSFELSQRLDEPPPRFIREYRNPSDGKLVHVFDINQTPGSLLEWRDHEAYSSKRLGHRNETNSSSSGPSSPVSSSSSRPVAYPTLPKPFDPACSGPSIPKNEEAPPQPQVEESETVNPFKIDETFDVLGGIEEHLSGLANVLQIAANTLQRAADKTRETDTSVVEDILQGVKGILTQVGSFGVEAFKEFGSEINTTVAEASNTQTIVASEEQAETSREVEIAARLAQAAKAALEKRQARKEHPSSNISESSQENSCKSPDDEPSSKVKFHLPQNCTRIPSKDPLAGSSVSSDRAETPSEQVYKSILPPTGIASKVSSQSFLDDSSEDADFTARYPPLPTIRRARSTIDRCSRWPESSTSAQTYSSNLPAQDSYVSPVFPPIPSPILSNGGSPNIFRRVDEEDKENVDPARKPLPGAWPDVKNDSMPTLPVSTESSGDFFNRMVGRGRPSRYRTHTSNTGLHRANTTASSNPASRLNGPFDPGFPYDTSSSHRPRPFRPYRHHRRSASPPRDWNDKPEATQSGSSTQPGSNVSSRCPPQVPAKSRYSICTASPSITGANPMSKFDSHRAIKHHRSVPHFYAPPPPPVSRDNIIVSTNAFIPPGGSNTSFQPGMIPPLVPFTSRPTFPSRATPPNLWAPWQSSPPMQSSSTSSMANESTPNFSNSITSRPEPSILDSPISSQSTGIKNFESSNSPPWSSAQPRKDSRPDSPLSASPMLDRPLTPRPLKSTSDGRRLCFPSPSPSPSSSVVKPWEVEPIKDKIDECVQQLKMCGFGIGDENLKNRLHVYAVAADGDVTEAVEMIEQDRQMSGSA